jgi:hyperosmotically inducible periplasmic protein
MKWHSARAGTPGAISTGMKGKFISVAMAAVLAIGFVGCASDDGRRTTGEYIDDKLLTQRVKDALGDNPVYKFPDVKVETFQGTVQLTGFVESSEQKMKAEQIARQVRGAMTVRNSILLKGETERVRETAPRTETPGTTTPANR